MTSIMTSNAEGEVLQQDDRVEYTNYWNDDNHLIAYSSNNSSFCNLWTQQYTIALMNNENKIVIKYPLPGTRQCFGIMTCPDKNIFVYVHCNYVNNDASIIIEIYHIIDNTINKLREFIIHSNHSVGGTSGIVQRVQLDGIHGFNVIWGDLLNSDECSSVTFTLDEHFPTRIFNGIFNNFEIEDIKNYYYYYCDVNSIILKSYVIAINNNNLEIAIKNCKTDKYFSIISEIELPYTHKYDNPTEVDSTILEFGSYNGRLLYLVRIKLETKVDVLHLERYGVDVLIDIENNLILSISPKIKYDNYDFAVNSSIYFTNEIPNILCKYFSG